jgi:hypothetical protein
MYPADAGSNSELTRTAPEYSMTHPDRERRVRFRLRTIMLMVISVGLGACSTMVTGGIPPSAFEFHPTIPAGGGQPAGWKVAQVVIMLGSASTSGPRAVWCDIEVGLPQVNYLAPVLDEEAQVVCAAAADQAARLVLQQGLEVSALICQRFQAEMAAVISKSIPGVRVTKIQTPGFQPKRFPEVDEVGLRGFPVGRSLSSLNR